jgi:uncharacterized protein (DUF486 family)
MNFAFTWPALAPVILLLASNVFMTTAWYWHLKYPHMAMGTAIVVSWLIAFVEYCMAVPANRIGYQVYSAAELKTMQEIITLVVFVVFAVLWLGQKFTLQHLFGFGLIALGACFIFNAPR